MSKVNKQIPDAVIERMISDRAVRIAVTQQSHYMFFHFYFAHYVKYETVPFQKEIFRLTEDETIKNLYLVAFRGSGKSTIITTSYPLWAILGKQQKKFVLILCQTRVQAKQHMVNLKRELEDNTLLKNDLGPFQEESDEWGSTSLVFSNTNARITAASSEQSIRGIRHGQHRPDLIIADDVEDMASAKTKEGRQKTYSWLKGEIVPLGDRNTKLVIVGNLLHEDSLLMHLKEDVETGKTDGIFKSYPLLGKDSEILWKGKYSNLSEIEREQKNLGNEIAWQREFLLQIISDEDQIFNPDQIQYYKHLPSNYWKRALIGTYLAISQKASADYTALVSGLISGYGDDFRIYILPNAIQRRMDFQDTLIEIKTMHDSIQHYGKVIILVEGVGYQQVVAEQLNNERYGAESISVSSDKRARLMSISNLVISGKVLFPEKGCEELIANLVGFGKEKHDDFADAFSILARRAIQFNRKGCRVFAEKPAGF